MARKQSDYLAALLADDASEQGNAPFPAPAREAPPERARDRAAVG
jgi:ParB family transcriptional regulator, chromosome partitioning protein